MQIFVLFIQLMKFKTKVWFLLKKTCCQASLQPPVFTDSMSVTKLRPVRLCSRACTLAHLKIHPGRNHMQLVRFG